MTHNELYLEDLSVGDVFVSATAALDAPAIKTFAENFDPQPFHLDEEAAKNTMFGGLAASGWHTAALTMRLLVASVPLANGMIGAGVDITWPKPARPGDLLRVTTTVINITPSRSKPDRGVVTLRSETQNQHGDTVQILNSKVFAFRRSGDAR